MAFDSKFFQGMLTGAAGLILVKKFFFHHSQTHHHDGNGVQDAKTGRPLEHDLGQGFHECECGHQGHGKWHGTHEAGLSDII